MQFGFKRVNRNMCYYVQSEGFLLTVTFCFCFYRFNGLDVIEQFSTPEDVCMHCWERKR